MHNYRRNYEPKNQKTGFSFRHYLGEEKVWAINIDSKGWESPILHYAHSLEIREAVELAYIWLANYQRKKGIPHQNEPTPYERYLEPKKVFAAWRLLETTIVKFEENALETSEKELQRKKARLEHCFNLFQEMQTSVNTENRIAFEMQKRDIFIATDNLGDLIDYFFSVGKISSYSALLLHAYFAYLIMRKGQLKKIDKMAVKGKYLGGITIPLTSYFSPENFAGITSAGGLAVVCDYLHESLTKKINEDIPYGEFKSNFVDYAKEMKGDFTKK